MLAHQLDGGGNIIAFELCWDVHGEYLESVIQVNRQPNSCDMSG
jgi:hypothetical protein